MSAVCVLAASLALHGGSVVRPALLRSPPVAMQLFGRGRAKRAIEAPEQITVGSALPDVVRAPPPPAPPPLPSPGTPSAAAVPAFIRSCAVVAARPST